jgi:hypothetical protein
MVIQLDTKFVVMNFNATTTMRNYIEHNFTNVNA